MIKFDNEFRDSFVKYYGDITPLTVPNIVKEYLEGMCKSECLELAFNVVKASYITALDYQSYYAEASKRLSWEIAAEDMDKFIVSVAFYYIFIQKPKHLEKLLGARFVKRDVYKEIAEASKITVDKVKEMSTEHTYSVQLARPKSRDAWFYDLTLVAGSYAKCHSRKIGAVLVRDNSVISTGYNGPPRGVPNCDQRWYIDESFANKYGKHIVGKNAKDIEGVCPRRIIGFPSGKGLEVCPAGHAERNALINAARLGIKTKGTRLYMSCGLPCSPCLVEIINAGVKEIICTAMDVYDDTAIYILENSNLKIRLYDFMV